MPRFKVNLARDGGKEWEEFLSYVQQLEQAGETDISINVSTRNQSSTENGYIIAKESEAERLSAIKDITSRTGAFEVVIKPIRNNSLRTKQQNRALHLWFKMIKDECSRIGVTKTMFYKMFRDVELPVESEDIKELCRQVTGALFGDKTTTAIPANQLDDVCELMSMALSKRLGVAAPELPSLEQLRRESMLEEAEKCK